MYPNLQLEKDYIPSYEIYDAKSNKIVLNKEKNCKQFFPKTTKFTKDFLDKVHISKLAKTQTYVFDEEWRAWRLYTIVAALVTLFLFSFFGIVFMWYTDGFNNIIYRNLVLREGTPTFDMFLHPSPKPLIKIYLFNYTNVDRYESGVDKTLHVEEKGPYVYEETTERINVKINGSYVSFQMKRTYKFMPELSGGRQNDIVVVPNLLMLSAAAQNRYANFLTRLSISSGLDGFYSKPFIRIAADRFIVGYDDELYTLSKSLMKFQNINLSEKLGLLSEKNGIGKDVVTIHTGQGDIEKLGQLISVNGKTGVDYWTTKECNSFEGTDGTIFNPRAISQKKTVQVFSRELQRKIDLVFKKENTIFDGDIPSYKYVVPDNIFDSADNYAPNQCFCEMEGGTCPQQGLHNLSLSLHGSPIFISNPHFYRADPELVENIEGLRPNESLHESYFDLHPKLGYPMNARLRQQVNIQILKSFGFSQLTNYQDNLILPMCWFEMALEDKKLPDDMKEIIDTTTHTVAMVENILKYGCIILAIVTLIPILANAKHRITRHRRTNSRKPLQRQEESC